MNAQPSSSQSEGTAPKRPASDIAPSPPSTVPVPEVVDLTGDDDKNKNDDNVIVPGETHNEQSDEDDESTMPLLYSLDTNDCRHLKIVGIRHYRGVAYTGEFVTLRREAHNPYDSNAIRVDNLRGEKVGHVAKEAAAILSPVWDRHDALVLDASIPWRGNAYFHPLCLDIRAPESLWEELKESLKQLLPYRMQKGASCKPRDVSVSTKKLDWKQQQAHLDQLWKDVLEKQLQDLPQVSPPEALQNPLLEHQKQALQWMVQREQSSDNPFYETTNEKGKTVYLCRLTNSSKPNAPSPNRGGILADDMGLGKTMSAISLVLAQPPPGRVYTPGQFAPQNNVVAASPADDASIAAVPVPTLKELREYEVGVLRTVAARLLPGSHHAATKKPELSKKPHEAFVASKITPQMFEQALQAPVAPSKNRPPWRETASLPITLIVAPVSVLSNWQDQIDAHVAPHTLRVGLYQGPQRHELLQTTTEYDILVTSYHTLQADFRPVEAKSKEGASGTAPAAKKKSKTASTIFELKFFRVLLDEAHMIRNQKTGLFRACEALQAERRWCLSGTPLTNKPEDIASLLSFLRLEPLHDRTVFRRCIAQPLKEGNEQGLTNLRLCMAFTALRRSKETISLPDKTVELRSVTSELENPHQKIYDTIFQAARAAFGAALKSDDNKTTISHANIFEILLRLRQSCCSGTLVPKERIVAAEKVLAAVQNKGHELTAEEGKELLEKLKGALQADEDDISGMPECAICMEELSADKAVVLRGCFHVFCKDCLTKTLEYKTVCAFCRTPYQQDDLIPYQKAEAVSAAPTKEDRKPASLTEGWDSIGPSPKMKALLLGLQEMKADEKGVVFSQFTTYLDQLQCFLEDQGWSYVRIDGSKSRAQRIQAIREFNAESGTRLVLCSLQLGQGINLTRGNHVFLMDTWWNKAVEQQAQDRCHRLGQTRACRIVRFVAADSIESRMVVLQEKKAALGKGVFENLSPDEKRQARMADLKKLLEL